MARESKIKSKFKRGDKVYEVYFEFAEAFVVASSGTSALRKIRSEARKRAIHLGPITESEVGMDVSEAARNLDPEDLSSVLRDNVVIR